MIALPTQKYLKECFDYDAETGNLIWKERPIRHFRSEGSCRTFNKANAGQIAGSVHKGSKGYNPDYIRITLTVYGKRIQARGHRLVWVWHTGDRNLNGLMVDHINGNTLDNRIENLRLATNSENQKNAKLHVRNTTGIMGVVPYPDKKYYEVRVYNRGRIVIGRYEDFFEACCARKSAELRFGYTQTHGKR